MGEFVDGERSLEMGPQEEPQRMAFRELALGRDDEGLDEQVRAPEMAHRLVQIRVGDLDGSLAIDQAWPSRHVKIGLSGRVSCSH
jgi:hypothetical protein